MEKKVKNWIEISTLVATVILGGATVWLGFETRGLKQSDIGPNISLSDVYTTILDETETAVRIDSWVNGNLKNGDALNIKSPEIYATLKFKNTGKEAGYIQLISITNIEGKSSSFDEYSESLFLVPANGETGKLYSLPIILNQTPTDISGSGFLKYTFQTFTVGGIKNNQFDLTVKCKKDVSKKYPTFLLTCTPTLR